MSDIKYDPFGYSISSFHVGADILDLFFFFSELFKFSMNSKYKDAIKQYFFASS